jgi:hypothetical protein
MKNVILPCCNFIAEWHEHSRNKMIFWLLELKKPSSGRYTFASSGLLEHSLSEEILLNTSAPELSITVPAHACAFWYYIRRLLGTRNWKPWLASVWSIQGECINNIKFSLHSIKCVFLIVYIMRCLSSSSGLSWFFPGSTIVHLHKLTPINLTHISLPL